MQTVAMGEERPRSSSSRVGCAPLLWGAFSSALLPSIGHVSKGGERMGIARMSLKYYLCTAFHALLVSLSWNGRACLVV